MYQNSLQDQVHFPNGKFFVFQGHKAQSFPVREINLSLDDGRQRAHAAAQAVAGFEDAGAGAALNIPTELFFEIKI
ncbi:hypothetical protein B9Z48_06440 [Limnohabitans sp. WS1]|nr:hypothetical protein B9Z48_06440 [Limnohabitans sp. WS1]